jgi:alpha-1,4-digalacturonate transport system permease protein
VPVYLVVTELGLVNSLWVVILPGVATPTGVFLLRQYMLTLPRDLIEAARMDKASEWQIYWRIVMPLTLPALAVLAIFSIMWRWNEFLWPLAVLTKTESYTRDQPRDALADMGEIASAVSFLVNQSSRSLTHELTVTPAGDRWVP